MMLGTGMRGLGSQGIVGSTVSACQENFWSKACWFPGADAPASIPVTPMPVSSCAGTLNADGSCTAVDSVNDPNATASELSPSGFGTQLEQWVTGMQTGATTPSAGMSSSTVWLLIGGGVLLLIGIAGGTAAGRHLR